MVAGSCRRHSCFPFHFRVHVPIAVQQQAAASSTAAATNGPGRLGCGSSGERETVAGWGREAGRRGDRGERLWGGLCVCVCLVV